MKSCRICKTNKWTYIFDDNTRIVTATCLKCESVVEFKAKPRKPYDPNKIEAKAHYKFKGKKHLLKIGKKFQEVCIAINKKGAWKVMPTAEMEKGWKLLHN